MADPISVLAVAGLVYAGRSLSRETQPPQLGPRLVTEPQEPLLSDEVPEFRETRFDIPVSVTPKNETPSFAVIAPQQRSGGQEILNMRNRMYDQGRMNNLSPIEKQMVGPGVGVGPNVPAYGGYQQLLRVNPVNVGAYRLTTLPGRSGPAHDISGGRHGLIGEMTHNMPEKTAFLPARRPEMPGRAQGMTGVTVRQEHERTKRTTNRSETGLRTDGLENAPAKRFIPLGTMAQDPTRNKSDANEFQYGYNNQPVPGIHSFHGGYTTAPGNMIATERSYKGYTTEQLQKYGFRPDDRRGKANRPANAGRMNVREAPLKQSGLLSSVRADTSRIDGRINAANGAWTQQYTNDKYYNFNPYKGNENPNARCNELDVAKNQLANNPLAQRLY
ncbi:hypothetical protein [Dishui Lake phycodnavirus 3]|nr:hypothetical protein [Dishui Lake phycodnavirus 3]